MPLPNRTSSPSSHPSQSLHDLLSSGEIESALSSYNFSPSSADARDDDDETPSSSQARGKKSGDDDDDDGDDDDDRLGIRLPLLLRWLSVAQPLATIVPIPPSSSSDHERNDDDFDDDDDSRNGRTGSIAAAPDIDAIVPLLEDAAASHPDAENVEVLASSLAPSVCREAMGKQQQQHRSSSTTAVVTLSRSNNGAENSDSFPLCRSTIAGTSHGHGRGRAGGGGIGGGDFATAWNTKPLDDMLRRLADHHPAREEKKKRRMTTEELQRPDEHLGKKRKTNNNNNDGDPDNDPLLEKMKMVIDILEENNDDDDEDDAKMRDGDGGLDQERSEEEGDDDDAAITSSFLARASSDANSHEAVARRTLRELVGLVRTSLRSGCDDDGGTGGDGEAVTGGGPSSSSNGESNSNPFFRETGFMRPGLTSRPDSSFAQEDNGVYSSSSSSGGWSRLSVTIPVLMQHATVLRHEHVANALCRAAAPQASALIMRMGANCPSATQNLLRGCIAAHGMAEKFLSLNASNAVVDGGGHAEGEVEGGGGGGGNDDASGDLSGAREILRVSVESARRLASLSRREALGAIRTLKERRTMDGLAFSLLMARDPIGAAAFVVERLAAPPPKPMTVPDAASGKGSDGKRPRRTLRQRMTSGRSFGSPHRASDEGASVDAGTAVPLWSRLRKELVRDEALGEKARRFISRRIALLPEKSDEDEEKAIGLGEATLFIQAYTLLVHSVGVGAGSSAGSGSKFVDDAMTAIRRLSHDGESCCEDLPTRSSRDDIYKMSVCASIITCCKYPPIGNSDRSVSDGPAAKACFDCLQGLLLRPVSVETVVFSSRLAGFILEGDGTNLTAIALGSILSHHHPNDDEKEYESQSANVCRWLSSKLSDTGELKIIHEKGLAFGSLVHDPLVAVEAMRRSNSRTPNELDNLMKRILADPNVCAKILRHTHARSLVQESVKMLDKRPPPHIPLVLPISLERLAQSLPWDKIGADEESTGKLLSQFALQLAYAFEFFDRRPLSPFVIDPRLFPLKESISFLNSRLRKSANIHVGFGRLEVRMKELISKHCPDIFHFMETDSHFSQGLDESAVSHRYSVKPTMVCKAIRDCLKGGHSVDPAGLRAEKCFMICRSIYPCSEVDVAAAGAILATGNSQPKFYSYAALCKDPLVLLKSSAAVWKYRGMRCIILRILQALMNANECIAIQTAELSVAREYLASRDIIITRSIVFACASGFVFGRGDAEKTPRRARHCMMCVNMIRSITSKRRGIIAALIKQGVPDFCTDWIVEFIPESLSDAPMITSLLSEIGSLTATERLAAASAGLRIAVAHSIRGKTIAKMLVLASTSVLLDSFSLVIGPIGVPVSILREDNGEDVTNVCREKMFRMIKTMSTISPENKDLKIEASITLSKIAALCKSENAVGGVSGAAASKRKILLKEIWDTCVQANTALGGEMQL